MSINYRYYLYNHFIYKHITDISFSFVECSPRKLRQRKERKISATELAAAAFEKDFDSANPSTDIQFKRTWNSRGIRKRSRRKMGLPPVNKIRNGRTRYRCSYRKKRLRQKSWSINQAGRSNADEPAPAMTASKSKKIVCICICMHVCMCALAYCRAYARDCPVRMYNYTRTCANE